MTQAVCLGPVAAIQEPGSKGYQVGEQRLFAVRSSGGVYLYLNRCPHLGMELEWQPDRLVDCQTQSGRSSTHGALFLIETGECVSGPCSGQFLEPIPHGVRDGELWALL